MAAPSGSGPPPALHTGIVKSVLSGDSIVIRGVPRGGPPPEKNLALSSIVAPKLERRPNAGEVSDQKDEPFAWEAREFLREKLVGKEVTFSIEYKAPSGREYGLIYIEKDPEKGNYAELLVSEGLAEVRQVAGKTSEYLQKLNDLQAQAKAAGKGKWAPEEERAKHVRQVSWTQENPRMFLDSLHIKPQSAVIEHVRDGSTVRAFLLPSFNYVTVQLSGIKCPGFRVDNQEVEEPFAREAQYFVESRLLQRNVEITLESVSNANFIGTVMHPNGNIAEALLKEGFARCVDWSIRVVSAGPEKLRAAEKFAKDRRLRLWKNYESSSGIAADSKDKTFQAKVIEVINADALNVRKADGSVVKVWLSSVRPPRADDMGGVVPGAGGDGRPRRPLYEVPFMFEAREFLRKKIIGKKVNVTVDYIQPPFNDFAERMCCTVSFGGQNLAEALVLKGLATVVRYKAGDDNRSSVYDALLAAEAQAEKANKGLHAYRIHRGGMGPPKGGPGAPAPTENGLGPSNPPPVVRVQDMSVGSDAKRNKQFLPFLQRAGRSDAVVEFVASGSRLRCYVPKESCLITLLLSGINCPRNGRTVGDNVTEGEPYGNEAYTFTRDLCLQQDVAIEVEATDRVGNFVGSVFVNGKNLTLLLVEQGLASVHFTAERLAYYNALVTAEEEAKRLKKGIWEKGVPTEPEDEEEKENAMVKERVVKYRPIAVTDIDSKTLHFWAQNFEDGPKLEGMMGELRAELAAHPPLAGAFEPRRGLLCAARFTADDQWYRARIESVRSRETVEIFFVDFGNRETTSASKLATLPAQFQSIPAGAHEYALAFVEPPKDDPDMLDMAYRQLSELIGSAGSGLAVNGEYRAGGVEFVSLRAADKLDIGRALVEGGYALVQERREARFASLVADYRAAMDQAKRSRLNIWEYGDFTGTEI